MTPVKDSDLRDLLPHYFAIGAGGDGAMYAQCRICYEIWRLQDGLSPNEMRRLAEHARMHKQ